MRSGTAVAIRAVMIAAESLGVRRDRMLAALGMRLEDLTAYEVRVAYGATAALWDAIARELDDPLAGLRVGRAIASSGTVALFEYTVRAAPTVADAWTKLAPLLVLFFGEGYEPITREVDGHHELGYRLLVDSDPPIPMSEESLVMSFVTQCRAVAPGFAPAALCLQHANRAPHADWRRIAGCAVEFDAPFYGVRLSERAYRSPIPGHDPSLAGLIDNLSRQLVAAPATPPAPADPAIRAIRGLLDRREPVTVDAVARELHVSPRTLQRQLAAAQTSVRAELDRARRDAALAMLRDRTASIAEIADRLGFADPSQLTRAVRRWTGAAPTELRKRR